MVSRMEGSDSEGEYLLQDEEVGQGSKIGMIDVFHEGFSRLVEYRGTSSGDIAEGVFLSPCCNWGEGLSICSSSQPGNPNLTSPVYCQNVHLPVSLSTSSSQDPQANPKGV